jgi:hypothetical protein
MTTYYVTPTGSNSNDGTSISTSYLTIKYACAQTTHGSLSYGGGHTVLVYPAAGADWSYAENNTINLQVGGRLQKGLTLKAITGSYDVAIDFTNNDDSVGIKTYLFTKIEGFTFTKAPEQTNSPTSAASVISGDGSTTGPIHVVNCTFDNCSGSSANSEVIDVPGPYTPSAGQSVIERCVFKNCFRPLIANGSTSPSFRTCLAHDCTSSKSTFDAVFGTIENCTAVRCRVVDDANQHIFSVSTAGASVAQIRNCVASYCYTKGYLMNSSADPPISASLAYDNIFNTSRLFGSATADCATTDPQFVDLAGDDFHLKCASPASGSGTGHIAAGAFGHASNTIIASQSHDLDGVVFDGRDSLGPYRNMGCYDTGGPNQRLRFVDSSLTYVPGVTLTLRCLVARVGISHTIIGVAGTNIDKFIGVEAASIGKSIGVE